MHVAGVRGDPCDAVQRVIYRAGVDDLAERNVS